MKLGDPVEVQRGFIEGGFIEGGSVVTKWVPGTIRRVAGDRLLVDIGTQRPVWMSRSVVRVASCEVPADPNS